MGIDLQLVPEIRRNKVWEPAVPFRQYVHGPFLNYEELDRFYSCRRYGLLYYLIGYYGDDAIPELDRISTECPVDCHPDINWYWHRIVDPGRRFWVPLKSLVDYPYDLEYTGEIDQYDPPENAGAPLKALKLDSEATAHHFLDENLPELIKLGPVEDTRVYFFFM